MSQIMFKSHRMDREEVRGQKVHYFDTLSKKEKSSTTENTPRKCEGLLGVFPRPFLLSATFKEIPEISSCMCPAPRIIDS